MGRSQETFLKKEREKKRARKKKDKLMKKEARKSDSEGGGVEIDWANAPENKTLTEGERDKKKNIKASNLNLD